MCIYAQPLWDLLPQMFCTKLNASSYGVFYCKQCLYYTPTRLYVKHLHWQKAWSTLPTSPLSPCQDHLPNCFAVPAIHSTGLGLHRHWVLRLQTPCGSLHFGIRELFSFPRKWHPECFLFSFCFVLKCCQNGFDFKSPGYFGNTEVPRCFWMFMIAAPANLKLNECV